MEHTTHTMADYGPSGLRAAYSWWHIQEELRRLYQERLGAYFGPVGDQRLSPAEVERINRALGGKR